MFSVNFYYFKGFRWPLEKLNDMHKAIHQGSGFDIIHDEISEQLAY
jgi:hypothetical protein